MAFYDVTQLVLLYISPLLLYGCRVPVSKRGWLRMKSKDFESPKHQDITKQDTAMQVRSWLAPPTSAAACYLVSW